jgi:ABC-type polysaccharide/polyol phosphate transport system ATPase subunit
MSINLGVEPQFSEMVTTIPRTVQMLSDGMKVQLDFYLVPTVGHKILLRYDNEESA